MFDVIIIGAGVNGAFVAYRLAKYQLKVLVIDKESDVCNETSGANSAIIHSGYDPDPSTLKAKLNVMGNSLYDEICHDLDVEFKRIGSITIACNEEEIAALDQLTNHAVANKVPFTILDEHQLREKEPFVTKKAKKALYAPTSGIINPFELCVALMENAMDNGIFLHLEEEVKKIVRVSEGFQVITDQESYLTKIVVNAAGVFADEINNMVCPQLEKITPRKGEYLVFDHFIEPYVTHTLFSVPTSKGKGVLVSPSTHGNYLIGPSSTFIEEKDDESTTKETLNEVIEQAYRLVDYIPMNHLIRQFAGLRAYHESNDFVINQPIPGFINLLGMQSPGLASAPATSLEVEAMIKEKIDLVLKENYQKTRRPLYRLNKKTLAERNELIKQNSQFANMICRCEQISEGEIVDAIHRNCGARTIKGVKKRVRPGFGKCQGGFCEPLVMKILARELKIDMKDVRFNNKGSYILKNKTKGENDDRL
ncbi:MAG TPA: NAD(P)/FAD-dependent oxidoreductase [Bacilli bacterium]|jgi:glycerol-3-phosphate dehydrogenase|nr:NAD(P)/FAD-dependent oxidoreductase [Bacilli bacterium]